MSTQQVSNDAAVCLLTNVISVNHVETMYSLNLFSEIQESVFKLYTRMFYPAIQEISSFSTSSKCLVDAPCFVKKYIQESILYWAQ